jgi:chorismate dehydratase
LTLRVGQIDYANCTPIFECLKNTFDCSNYQFIHGVPAHLNGLLLSGAIDLCPSSSIEFASHPQEYLVLPELSISSVGPVQSVLLISRVPIDQLNLLPVAITGDSATSVRLLQIILRKFYGYENRFSTVQNPTLESLADFPALLLIGDAALKAGGNLSHGEYVYDLGELWYKFTGLPFVFALWMVREATAVKQRHEVETLFSRLCQAKKIAATRFGAIASDCHETWISPERMVEYWKTISYDLTVHHLAGVRTFFRYAAEARFIDHEPEIRFFEGKCFQD